MKRLVAHHLSRFAEGLEGVLRLSGHQDVADESEIIVLARRIRELARHAQRRADDSLRRSGLRAKLQLVLLEHALVLPHVRNVPRAEIAKASVFGLLFMVLQRVEEDPVLRDGVDHLLLQKSRALNHSLSPFLS